MSIHSDLDFHISRANDLLVEERFKEARSHLEFVLDMEPLHVESLISMADIYAFHHDALSLDEYLCDRISLQYYDRALSQEWKNADAWGGKAIVLLHLGRVREALTSCEIGLFVLPLCIGCAMDEPSVHNNVAETIFDAKVRSLIELKRRRDACRTLSDALIYCPGSEYLTELVDEALLPRMFGPNLSDNQ